MTICSFCHTPLPDQAKFCPNCGSPVPSKRPFPLAKLLILLAVFVVLAAATILLSIQADQRAYAENHRANPVPDWPGEAYYGSGRYSDLSMEVSFR